MYGVCITIRALCLPISLDKSSWVLPFLPPTGDMLWWLERSLPWRLIPALQTKLLRQNCCWWHCGLNASSQVLNMFKEAACDHSFDRQCWPPIGKYLRVLSLHDHAELYRSSLCTAWIPALLWAFSHSCSSLSGEALAKASEQGRLKTVATS